MELQAVRATLVHDPDLQEMAQTPLMLSLMTLAYRGLTRADLRPLANKEVRRRHLFDHYVVQMFTRRPLPPDNLYAQDQVLRWLANLAHGMVRHEQSIFYIERLQPTWLPTRSLDYLYRLTFGLTFGLIFGLIVGLTFGLTFGLSIGLAFGLIFGLNAGPINLVEELVWQISSRQELWSVIKRGLTVGLIAGLAFGLIGGVTFGLIFGLSSGLIAGLSSGLIIVLSSGLEKFIFTREVMQRRQPNQGVRRSGWNGLRMALIGGLIGGLFDGLIGRLVGGLTFGLIGGLFRFGGNTLIQHYSLRWPLAWAGILPYPFRDGRLVAFLDAMHDRILLRRVGGGWIFVHRSLLEYFADLAEAPK